MRLSDEQQASFADPTNWMVCGFRPLAVLPVWPFNPSPQLNSPSLSTLSFNHATKFPFLHPTQRNALDSLGRALQRLALTQVPGLFSASLPLPTLTTVHTINQSLLIPLSLHSLCMTANRSWPAHTFRTLLLVQSSRSSSPLWLRVRLLRTAQHLLFAHLSSASSCLSASFL